MFYLYFHLIINTNSLGLNKKNPRKSNKMIFVGFVVEVTGVEPVSESRRHYLSPSAVHVLRFPQVHAHEQAYTLGSFINTPLAQSFARLRVPLQ